MANGTPANPAEEAAKRALDQVFANACYDALDRCLDRLLSFLWHVSYHLACSSRGLLPRQPKHSYNGQCQSDQQSIGNSSSQPGRLQ